MRLILLSFLTLTIWQTHAQIDLVNRLSQRTDSNFMFKDDPNQLEVIASQSSGWQLKTRSAQISVTDSPRLWIVEPGRIGPDTLQLLQKGKIVLTKIFQVIYRDNPVARWGALSKNTATVPEVIANRRMTLFVAGCNCNGLFRIVSYRMSFVGNQLTDAINIDGTILTAQAIQMIQKLRPGDKIIFEEIHVVGRSDRVRELPPFTITITAP
jgi:hypothetical protein